MRYRTQLRVDVTGEVGVIALQWITDRTRKTPLLETAWNFKLGTLILCSIMNVTYCLESFDILPGFKSFVKTIT